MHLSRYSTIISYQYTQHELASLLGNVGILSDKSLSYVCNHIYATTFRVRVYMGQ